MKAIAKWLVASAAVLASLLVSLPSAAQVKEFCWRDSYGRGVGTVPQACSSDRDRIGLLCYSKCGPNMKRVGFDCHSTCPSGMRDDGLFCRAAEYGRGAGFPWKFGDSLNDSGMYKRCEGAHGKGNCEKNGAIVYPKCKPGYSAVGCCICRPNPPNCSAMNLGGRLDLSCAKIVKIGDPVTGTCGAGQQKDAGLCYSNCKSGYSGVGPVCWSKAPQPTWVECGMGSSKDKTTCGSVTFGQVASVGNLALTVATLGTSTAGTGAAGGAADSAKLAKLKSMYKEMKAAYEAAKPAIDAAKKAKKVYTATDNSVELLSEDKVTEEDIARISAQIAAILDPTGLSDTVAAYTYPLCSKYFSK